MDREMMLQSPETKFPEQLAQHSTFFAQLAELILEWPLPTQIPDKEPLALGQHHSLLHPSKAAHRITENILGDSTEEISAGLELSVQNEHVKGTTKPSTETAKGQDVE